MNKICGYNCEHNKGGQCQITYCDKIGEITTTTQWLSSGRQQGKTYQLIKDQQKEIERLDKQVQIMEKYFELIIDLGYDYDGFNSVESLKTLIDELCKYASLGRVCNTTESIYANSGKHFNIIGEEIKGCGEK